MQSQSVNSQFHPIVQPGADLSANESQFPLDGSARRQFHGSYVGTMAMAADATTVAAYLSAHPDWFCRCARPMQANPLGQNAYELIIGRFNSLGYELQPAVCLELLPQDQGIYRIQTVENPNGQPLSYDVDFQAELALLETQFEAEQPLTDVSWKLDLNVTLRLPRFIQALPPSLVQNSGDRLLNQIVKQASRRLTQKVQADFHQTLGIKQPKK